MANIRKLMNDIADIRAAVTPPGNIPCWPPCRATPPSAATRSRLSCRTEHRFEYGLRRVTIFIVRR